MQVQELPHAEAGLGQAGGVEVNELTTNKQHTLSMHEYRDHTDVLIGDCDCTGACKAIRKKHAKNSYHMVCHHTLSKNGVMSYHQIVISYQNNVISYPLVCHHTNNCHFIPYRYVISYRKGINSYLHMSLYTSVVSYQNMSFHTPRYVMK